MQDKAKNAGKVAIVLEGGSFRGEFTAGVLDVLMENGVEVAACYGTSAGALNGLNYKSRQIGRVNRVNLAFCNDPRYMGAQSLMTTGSMVGYDFILNECKTVSIRLTTRRFLPTPWRCTPAQRTSYSVLRRTCPFGMRPWTSMPCVLRPRFPW